MESKRVLLIDDEKDFCTVVKMNLELSGKFTVLTASNGKEGIQLAKSAKPDVILLDIVMPKMDGFEVLKQLKKLPDTIPIPVIMLTAVDTDESRIKAAGIYSEYYITKPVTTNDLMTKIDSVLSLRGEGTS